MNKYKYNDVFVGMRESFTVEITEDMQLKFTKISGDINPMHVDSEFAKRGGMKSD